MPSDGLHGDAGRKRGEGGERRVEGRGEKYGRQGREEGGESLLSDLVLLQSCIMVGV